MAQPKCHFSSNYYLKHLRTKTLLWLRTRDTLTGFDICQVLVWSKAFFCLFVWFVTVKINCLGRLTCCRNKWLQSMRAAAGALLLALDMALHGHGAGHYLLLSRNKLSWSGAGSTVWPCYMFSLNTESTLQAGVNWNESIFKTKYFISPAWLFFFKKGNQCFKQAKAYHAQIQLFCIQKIHN